MSFLRSYALKCAVAAAVAALAVGCDRDGSKSLAAGKAAFAARDFAKAEKCFERCIQRSAGNPEPLVMLALARLEAGHKLEEARQNVEAAAKLAPGDHDIVLLDAQISWHLKDYERAKRGFTAIADNAKLAAAVRSQGWSGIGVVEKTLENRHLARIAFLRAIRLDSGNLSAWYNLGMLYRDDFEYTDAALEQFKIFVRRAPVADARVQRVQRTVIPELTEEIARAAAERPGAARRNSTSCAALIAKAEEATKKKAYKTAVLRYQEALAADALSYAAAVGLAKAQLKVDPTSKESLKKAFANYKLACALKPGDVPTFLAAGELAMRRGDAAEAVNIYSRALAANSADLRAIDGLVAALKRAGGKQKVASAYSLYRDSIASAKNAKGRK